MRKETRVHCIVWGPEQPNLKIRLGSEFGILAAAAATPPTIAPGLLGSGEEKARRSSLSCSLTVIVECVLSLCQS